MCIQKHLGKHPSMLRHERHPQILAKLICPLLAAFSFIRLCLKSSQLGFFVTIERRLPTARIYVTSLSITTDTNPSCQIQVSLCCWCGTSYLCWLFEINIWRMKLSYFLRLIRLMSFRPCPLQMRILLSIEVYAMTNMEIAMKIEQLRTQFYSMKNQR